MKDDKVSEPVTDSNSTTEPAKPSATQNGLPRPSRRGFLKGAGISAAAVLMPAILTETAEAVECGPPSANPSAWALRFENIRINAAKTDANLEVAQFPHQTNGDEELYGPTGDNTRAGNFSKTLVLDKNGLVTPDAYTSLLNACAAGTQDQWQLVKWGVPGGTKLAGPVSPLIFQMEGPDSPDAQMDPPPSISTNEGAAEMLELYWEALTRDVQFVNFATNQFISQAASELNGFPGFQGPTPVTPQTVFRYGPTAKFPNGWAGCLDGPYVSQILYQTQTVPPAGEQPQPIEFDGVPFNQKFRSRLPVVNPDTLAYVGPGVDFLTSFDDEYINVEQGAQAFPDPVAPPNNRTRPRFVTTIRDLGSLAASDAIYSIYFRASQILDALRVPLDPNNPYFDMPPPASPHRMSGFSTFSTSWLRSLIGNVHKTEAHAFYHKWYVHRKLRPEQYANLVDLSLRRLININPQIPQALLSSPTMNLVFNYNQQLNGVRHLVDGGTFLLPQELNGGSPSHPSSPAGHAFSAGACVTLLKAFYDTTKPWPVQAVVSTLDSMGNSFLINDTSGAQLTVLGELNKLAANISEGRNMSGIHWRVSDNISGMLMGEQVAIRLLTELAPTYPEKFAGFNLTKFDGTNVVVGGNL